MLNSPPNTQINILVGTIIASFQASAISYLYYADRIYQIVLAIAGIAIGTVILPQLSKLIQSENKSAVNEIQNKGLELSLFLSVPASVAIFIASTEIISALFGYGSFSETSVQNSALALFYFAFGLPAFSLIKIFSSFFFARHDTKIPFYISLFSVLINIIISVSLFNKVGFIIIPIATSISSWFNAIILYIFLRKKNFFVFNSVFISRFPRILFSSLIMGVIFYFLLGQFSEKLIYSESFKFMYLLSSILISRVLLSIIGKLYSLSVLVNLSCIFFSTSSLYDKSMSSKIILGLSFGFFSSASSSSNGSSFNSVFMKSNVILYIEFAWSSVIFFKLCFISFAIDNNGFLQK